MIKKKIIPALILFSAALLSARAEPVIRSAAEPDYPPLSILNPDGHADGFSVELLRAVLKTMGRDVVFRIGDWAEIRGLLEEGKIDVLPLAGRTPEREALYDFTFPYLTLHGALFIRNDNEQIRSVEDLQGRRIAVMKGDNAEEYTRRAALSDRILTTASFEEAFQLLAAGEADAVIAQKLVGTTLLKKMGLENIRATGRPNEEFKQDFCFAVRKGNDRLLALLNEGLALVTTQSRHRQIAEKWLSAAFRETALTRALIYGGDQAFPPYEFLDERGRPAGFNIDLTRALAIELGVDIVFELGPWNQVRLQIERGEIDLASMLYSAERDRVVDFCMPHTLFYQSIFTRPGSPDFKTFNELKGYRVSVQDGDLMHDYALGQGLKDSLIVVETPEEAQRLLAEGAADFSILSHLQGLYWIQKNGWTNLRALESRLIASEYCFVVPEGRTDLQNLINDGLIRLKESGQYREIYNKWLGVLDPPTPPYYSQKSLLAVLAGLIVVAILTGVFIAGLNRQVRKRTTEIQEANRLLKESRTAALNMMEDAVQAKESLEITQFSLDHSADAIFWVAPDGTFAYVNEAACKSLGYSKQELLRLSVKDIDPDFPQKRWPQHWQELKEKKSLVFETIHKTKDGRIFPVEIHASLLTRGNKEYNCAYAHDITERKLAGKALEKSEMLFRNLFEKHSAVKLLLDAETGAVLNVNQAAVAFYGWTKEQMLKMTFFEINTLSKDLVRQEMAKAKNSQQNYFEDQHRHAGDSVRDVAVFSSGIEVDGRTLLYTIVHDITASKKQENELRLLSVLIDQSPDAIVITGTDAVIRYVNPAFKTMSGYSAEEAIGQNPRFLQSGQHDAAFYADLWKTIAAGEVWKGRFINKRKNGTLYTEEAIISPVRDSTGKITGYAEIKRDVTEELAKEEQFRQNQKIQAIGQLAGGIAHDFNNILQAILGFSEILLGRLDPASPEHRNTTEIQKAARRASELTKQLLAFSRKQPVEPKRMNLNSAASDSEILLRLLLGKKIICRLELNPELHDIFADGSQITQIIMNLAVNARDAMPDGGRLTLSTENITVHPHDSSSMPEAEPGIFACLSVTDTGHGMSQEVKDHLFEPFFTTKGVGQGTGLGLSVVYGIVKQNKGWIHVYSEEGLGTTVKVYLPACENSLPPDGLFTTPDQPRTERILLVEDDADTQDLVVRILKTAGYEILATDTAEEALRLFEQDSGHFDLLFSDMTLPGKSGLELADQIRSRNPGLPILLYSGYRDQRERWQNLESKGYSFLQKPFSLSSLLAAVHDALINNLRS